MSAPCPVYGFEFTFRATSEAPDDVPDPLWADFIDVVERHGLSAGGGAHGPRWHHVITRVGSQATDQDRQLLLAWASDRDDVADAAAGPLVDLDEGI